MPSDRDKNLLAFLALASIKGVGFETLRRLCATQVDLAALITSADGRDVHETLSKQGARISREAGQNWAETRSALLERASVVSDELTARGIRQVLKGDADYPAQLNDLVDPPQWLFVEGSLASMCGRSVAVVGSRKADSDGLWLTRYVGYCLRDWRMATVSGLAEGVDQEIHRASIAAGLPTIAFLGTGILRDYPVDSDRLRHQIIATGGAIASEYLPNDSYSAVNFVRRNRLQAALAQCLIPTQWSTKSGTAHTVDFACKLQRRIALVRVNTQPDFQWVLPHIRAKASRFTLPFEHEAFQAFVGSSSEGQPDDHPTQLQLL